MSCDRHDNALFRHGNASATLTCSCRWLAWLARCHMISKPHGVNLIGAIEFRYMPNQQDPKSVQCVPDPLISSFWEWGLGIIQCRVSSSVWGGGGGGGRDPRPAS